MSTSSPDPLAFSPLPKTDSPDPLATAPAPRPKRGRNSNTVATIGGLRRSKRHSTGPSTPDAISIKQEKSQDEERPPAPKKRRGRPSKAAMAVENAIKREAEETDSPFAPGIVVKEESNSTAGPSTESKTDTKPSIRELAALAASSRASKAAISVESKREVPPEMKPSIVASSQPSPSHTHHTPTASSSIASHAKKAGVKKSSKKEQVEKPAKPEKRASRIRANAPKSTMQRAQRVMSQRMYLVHREKYPGTTLAEQFKVLGSTGNVYTIKIDSTPSCNCPDCLKGNLPCKHIIFVFLKVLKVPTESPLWFQKSFLLSELEEVFSAAPNSPTENVVSVKVRNAYLKAMGLGGDEEAEKAEEQAAREAEEAAAEAAKDGRKWTVGDDCPVCYDEMSEEDEQKGKLVFDEALNGCGKPLHAECFKMWAATARAKGDDVTCVWCRTPWPMADAAGAGKGKEKAPGGLDYSALGYLNMADLVGMSRQRDTSSYYQGPIAGRSYANRYADD